MASNSERPIPVLVDTDPGVDDALALALAFASPELSVRAVTTVAGNVDLATATANAVYLMNLLQPNPAPRLSRGSAKPLECELVTAQHVHATDGLAGVTGLEGWSRDQIVQHDAHPLERASAVEVILDEVANAPEPLTIVALGPLTNVATAIAQDRMAMQRVSSIVVMGGSLDAGGNVTPHAEFNFYVDPEAAELVVKSGLPVLVVPLDVTNRLAINDDTVEKRLLASETRDGILIGEVVKRARAIRLEGHATGQLLLHDPGAVAALLWPELFTLQSVEIGVDRDDGDRRGAVIYRALGADPVSAGRSAVQATVEVQADEVVRRVTDRLASGDIAATSSGA